MICTDVFGTLGKLEAEQLGMSDLPLVVITHPLGGQPAGDVERLAEQTLVQLASAIATAPRPAVASP